MIGRSLVCFFNAHLYKSCNLSSLCPNKPFGKWCAELPEVVCTSEHIHTLCELMRCKGGERADGCKGQVGPAKRVLEGRGGDAGLMTQDIKSRAEGGEIVITKPQHNL